MQVTYMPSSTLSQGLRKRNLTTDIAAKNPLLSTNEEHLYSESVDNLKRAMKYERPSHIQYSCERDSSEEASNEVISSNNKEVDDNV